MLVLYVLFFALVAACLVCIPNEVKWLVRASRAQKNGRSGLAEVDMSFKWLFPLIGCSCGVSLIALIVNLVSKK